MRLGKSRNTQIAQVGPSIISHSMTDRTWIRKKDTSGLAHAHDDKTGKADASPPAQTF